MSNTTESWINLKESVFIITPDNDVVNHHNIIVLMESKLQLLTDFQRLIFLIATVIVTSFAVIGNVSVLVVSISRFDRELQTAKIG